MSTDPRDTGYGWWETPRSDNGSRGPTRGRVPAMPEEERRELERDLRECAVPVSPWLARLLREGS